MAKILITAPVTFNDLKSIVSAMVPNTLYEMDNLNWLRIDEKVSNYTWSNCKWTSKDFKSLTAVKTNMLKLYYEQLSAF